MSVFQEINRKKANLFWHIIDIVSSLSKFFGDMYKDRIGIHYINEAQMYNINEDQSILHIGSGAYPITALVLAKLFKGRIVTIDKNPIVIKIAKRVIKKEHLSHRIEVLYGNGLTFDVSSFDVVIISSCSVPKEEILTHVFSHTNNHCKIIVRELNSEIGELKKFVKRFNNIIQTMEIRSCAIPNLCWNSFFFEKKKQ